jgi:hypothetical protein
MLVNVLLVTHIVVLGYWLGSEFVINSGYRYVCRSADMPFDERDRLMNHVLEVDQHVRYALILQIGLGTTLAALLGYIPGESATAAMAAIVTVAWLAFVEIAHRQRDREHGARLAFIDRSIRYLAMLALAAIALASLASSGGLPAWLAWKLLLFAGVMACGVGIRYSIIDFYRIWAQIRESGLTPDRQARIWFVYRYGTAILIGLWVLIAGIAALSVWKP